MLTFMIKQYTILNCLDSKFVLYSLLNGNIVLRIITMLKKQHYVIEYKSRTILFVSWLPYTRRHYSLL